MDSAYAPLIESYGPWAVFAINALSCLGFPIPALVVMLIAGAWATQAGLSLWPWLVAGYAGAILPGIAVFWAGRRFGPAAIAWAEARRGAAALIARGRATEARWGGAAIFLGSSFAAQLGPAVNLLAGAAGTGWRRFHVSHFTGRAIWVGGYTGLGYLFSGQLDTIVGIASAWTTAILAALALLVPVLLWRAVRRARRPPRRSSTDDSA